jgi:lipopolysaccharide biosynthesis glycosyltransferase
MQEVNIITSSDAGLVSHLFTQMKNISFYLGAKYDVHIWFFHYRVEKSDIEALTKYSDFLKIHFHEIYVDDYEKYDYFNKGADEKFPIEAYFYFLAHKYLPESVDRALMIDAGDIIFDGDIGEFYFEPFEDKFLITSMAFSNQREQFTAEDLKDPEKERIIVIEYINSGAMMLNLEKMRQEKISFEYYNKILDFLMQNHKPFKTQFYKDPIYYAYDQGLFAAAFVGKIKFWGYDEIGYNSFFMPYNFRPFVIETEKERLGIPERGYFDPGYKPYIIHLLGNKP